ncbi:MAG: amidase family protein [Gammaproteobacteria bacterium]|nr:amidase family protein [Gammaproteobacteria bacterium]MDE0649780.1 amidase family protein [Gammaproteobacteria bacterium]
MNRRWLPSSRTTRSRTHTFRPIRLLLAVSLLLAAPGAAFAQDFELEEATIAEVHAAFLSGDLTCVDLVQGYLDRIEAYDQQGPQLNTIANLNPAALDEAARLDQSLAGGGLSGPLHCVPVLLKDQVETHDMPTTYGSALFADFVSSRDATIVTRMEDAGALIIAKTNMGEFASRYVGSGFGFIRNPYDPRRNPSGSSGGTGAGVAANLGLIGIGEDTGGSIRGPSAVHALVGLRPTLQLVSRYGMMPANPTTDTMGPMTRTVMDAAILLDAIAGYDPNDPVTAMSAGQVPDSYSEGLSEDGLDGARIGVIRDPMDQALDTDSEGYRQARAIVDAAVEQLRTLGAEVVDNVAIPGVDGVNAIYSMNPHETEAATDAYLAELDDPPYTTLRSILLSGRVTPWRATGLANSLGKTTRDPGYLAYLLARDQLRQDAYQVMADHNLDALVHTTFDHPPSLIAPDVETNPSPADNYGLGDNRLLSPLTGWPALTVPAGFTPDGLPIGIEFLGRPFTEEMLIRFGYAFEQATGHRRPPESAPPLR